MGERSRSVASFDPDTVKACSIGFCISGKTRNLRTYPSLRKKIGIIIYFCKLVRVNGISKAVNLFLNNKAFPS